MEEMREKRKQESCSSSGAGEVIKEPVMDKTEHVDGLPVSSFLENPGFDDLLQRTTEDNDAEHLLSIFPEEVWLVILDQVRDPQLMLALYNASAFFRTLLLPRRTLFLFPQVWSILCESEENANTGRRPKDSSRNQMRIAATLNLRLVCRNWRDAVDNFYQIRSGYRDDKSVYGWTVRYFKVNRYSGIRCSQYFRRGTLLSRRVDPAWNPFFGRTINIELHSVFGQISDNVYFERLFAILSKFGHHVWNAMILMDTWACPDMSDSDDEQDSDEYEDEQEDEVRPWLDWYSTLRRLLELMPNLKELQVRYPIYTEDQYVKEKYDNQCTDECGGDEFRVLDTEIQSRPLPRLAQLERLEILDVPRRLTNELIRSNGHVKGLHLTQRLGASGIDLLTVPPASVEDLSMEIHSEADIEMLEDPRINWKLQKISELSFRTGDEFIEWPLVFRMLETKWADTLSEVTIRLPRPRVKTDQDKIIAQGPTLRLNLPHVKIVCLWFYNLASLDFLLPMRDLERLEVNFNFYFVPNSSLIGLAGAAERGATVKFTSFLDNLFQSNIWQLFPKLNYVSCRQCFPSRCKGPSDEEEGDFCSFTRQGWRDYERNKRKASQTFCD